MNETVDFKQISVHEGPEQSPGFLLWRISTSWRTSIEAVLKTLGLTHPQFVILAATGWLTMESKSTNQVTIGKMAGLDPNTTSQIIKGLEEKELIKRSPSSDGRAKSVSLTLKGSKILNQALPSVEQTDAKFFSTLTKKELSALIHMFEKLIDKNSEL